YEWARSIAGRGKLENSLKEFWSENPWDIVTKGHNLSAYERKRTWMNIQGKNFIDLSYLTGTDNNGDGRSVVAGDFRNIGRLDLLTRNAGGGTLMLHENN